MTQKKHTISTAAVTSRHDASVPLPTFGIEWLQDVPGHWEVQRLKFIARNMSEQSTVKARDEIYLALEHVQSWTGVARPLKGTVEFASTVKRFFADDILFGKLRPYLAKVTRANCVGVCVSEFLVLRPRKELILPAYLEHLLRCKRVIDLINSATAGAKMPRVDWAFIGNVRLPLPPLPEQKQIAAYLRAQDAHIARFIKAKRELIKLLTEQKLRIIDHAVTHGLDASVALKPSGIEWLGDVPVHWEVPQLRRVSRCLDGARIPLNATERGLRQGTYPYWGANKVIDHLDGWLFDEPLVLLGEDGAPFFDKTKEVAFAVSGKIWVNNHAHVLRPSSRITPRYLAHALNCVDYTGFVDGSTRDKLTQQSMKSIRIPLPQVSEQIEICKHIESACASLNVAIEKTEREITLIREYRDRLITDVVTGQVDVRGWQPGQEDVVEDAVLAALGDDQEEMTEQEDDDDED
ncbi:hypothetical protein ADT32_07570 [Xylella fastidiosa]|uniref:restriction endonuclease subunit S n=1 Tax=Xylella fastidiosa TaxID=2371 RepID=UPI00069BCE3E|nr:restriction endonuclease subunit S [Xylella fastidiosa]KXB10618.1 hypothetical protein ADT32_07570 [Xylella fastidiosa]KXB14343.1 hypothetical protein ADT33_06485 [Xylella fastidiosa]KXB18853.1 hypothetical protein ADT31_01605 [Xylella fastidiosa]